MLLRAFEIDIIKIVADDYVFGLYMVTYVDLCTRKRYTTQCFAPDGLFQIEEQVKAHAEYVASCF